MFSVEQIISEQFPSLSRSPAMFTTTLSRVLRLILREKDFALFSREYPDFSGADFSGCNAIWGKCPVGQRW